jgi:RND family efflux transporter MFP subunit
MNKFFVLLVIGVAASILALGGAAYLNQRVASAGPQPAATTESAAKQLWTCGMHPQVIRDHPGNCPICRMRLVPMRMTDGAGGGGPPAVIIDPAVVQNMGVRTAKVTRGRIARSVRTVGTLEAPESGLHDIAPKVGGWVEKLYVKQEGVHVKAGDPLFDLYSPELVVAEEELVGAVKSMKALGDSADASVRRSGEELVASAKRKLALLDVPEQDIAAVAEKVTATKTVTFRSPADGAIIEKAVVEGSPVQAGTKLMRVEDHSSLWLDLQVYEGQMALVTPGVAVEATVEAWPGRVFKGTVTFIHPHVDHMSRTATARVTLENPDMTLHPGMYASAVIHTRPVEDVVQAPREAVIDTGVRKIAFVAHENGHFEPRKVTTGLVGDDGRVQILEGLKEGEQVVTSGQFLMDVESRTVEAVEKLRSGAAAAPEGEATATTTAPATSPAAELPLVVAYCPMKKATWLQRGEQIANPYYGSAMLDCGDVRKKLDATPLPQGFGPVVDAYLKATRALASDRLDLTAAAEMKEAAAKLDGNDVVKAAAAAFAAAKDLKAARAALAPLSDALAHAIDGGRP